WLFRGVLPGVRRGARPVVREERRRAVAAHAQPVVARPGRQRRSSADGARRRGAGHRATRRCLVRCAAARSTALRHRRRAVLAGVLRGAGAGVASRRAAVPLHRQPEQADQRTRRAARGGAPAGTGGVPGGAGAGRGACHTAVSGYGGASTPPAARATLSANGGGVKRAVGRAPPAVVVPRKAGGRCPPYALLAMRDEDAAAFRRRPL